ncbi:MAG: hypothetical protein N3A62_06730 [Thermodesulfovibrionales bacterium]|nr:hypothetical protein [Thermodesulfovibrionales bacterium]
MQEASNLSKSCLILTLNCNFSQYSTQRPLQSLNRSNGSNSSNSLLGGLLRKINHLARGLLIASAKEKMNIVSPEHVRIAETELI